MSFRNRLTALEQALGDGRWPACISASCIVVYRPGSTDEEPTILPRHCLRCGRPPDPTVVRIYLPDNGRNPTSGLALRRQG